MKGNLELETTRHMKNSVNVIRHHEICRVWDVSLSHVRPNVCEFFGDKVSYSKAFCHLMRLYLANCARNLFQNEKTTTSPQSVI